MFDRRGVTMVEVLIAVSLFTIVTVVANSVFVSIVELEKKSTVQNAIFEDLRIIMQQLTYEIQHGAIDYEEYYNACVIQDGCKPNREAYLGINYGVYGSRFFDPGAKIDKTPAANPKDLGAECDYPKTLNPGDECEIIHNPSIDLNVGQNPFTGDGKDANAFCDKTRGLCGGGDSITVNELYLIDETGMKKTMIGKKLVQKKDWSIGKVVLDGKDLDQNGLIDTFVCAEAYHCFGKGKIDQEAKLAGIIKHPFIKNATDVAKYGISIPLRSDLTETSFLPGVSTSHFVPITPLRSNVKKLEFVIHPVEDPYKAFTETDMKGHPSVTITVTLGLSEDALKDYPGEFNDVTFTTTVASGVVGRMDTYPPITDIKEKNLGGWIDSISTVPGFKVNTVP